jgi:hypothetical protein
MKLDNKKILIGAGIVVIGYLLWKKSQRNSLKSRTKQMECDIRYSELAQPGVVKPPEYWKKKEEEWMKVNCK